MEDTAPKTDAEDGDKIVLVRETDGLRVGAWTRSTWRDEVQRIADLLGRRPTREEFEAAGYRRIE